MTDEQIVTEWRKTCRLYDRGSLGRRIAGLRADQLEAQGVTEADIERLFPIDAALARGGAA